MNHRADPPGPIELVQIQLGDTTATRNLVAHEYLDGHLVGPSVPSPTGHRYIVLNGRVFIFDPAVTSVPDAYAEAAACPPL